MNNLVDTAARLIRDKGKKTIALTGAGVSTESGIPDFRSKGGLWSRYDPMEYGTLGAFRRDPVKVWTMLAELIAIADAKPNKGHTVMAQMEKAGLLQGVITQNIDMLHQKAGSMNVVEFHGAMNTFTCMACKQVYRLEEVLQMKLPPACSCGEVLKPDVVFFDESIPAETIQRTEEMIHKADLLIVAGTSCQVVPASSIPFLVKQHGGIIIEINLEPALAGTADISLQGSFTRIMRSLSAALEM